MYDESFKPIKGFEDYLINTKEEVYSLKSKRILKNQINTNGYSFVRFHYDNLQYSFLIHRLLAFVFLDLPSLDSELQVDHIDSNQYNNDLSNLQVLSFKEHMIKTHGSHYYTTNCRICSKCETQKLSEFNTSGICKTCLNKAKLVDGITAELIEFWVTKYSWTKASKELGLSDSGLRKRYKRLTGNNPSNLTKHSKRPSK